MTTLYASSRSRALGLSLLSIFVEKKSSMAEASGGSNYARLRMQLTVDDKERNRPRKDGDAAVAARLLQLETANVCDSSIHSGDSFLGTYTTFLSLCLPVVRRRATCVDGAI
ncbi:hypothetical protein HPP92_017251 [Vanilla planifolia]|uniref:Uncharacterized protein n=1 Tax=Vanilla planifolia TaxID=51239 RepID=A0A835QAS8_VANPL|nr:hypothetical protein HPP92_017251 [Vanilla planifolia]